MDEFLKPDLRAAWHDAALAADLAERLAATASDAEGEATCEPGEAEELAVLADEAADASDRAATSARETALRVRRRAVSAPVPVRTTARDR